MGFFKITALYYTKLESRKKLLYYTLVESKSFTIATLHTLHTLPLTQYPLIHRVRAGVRGVRGPEHLEMVPKLLGSRGLVTKNEGIYS
jgi:hypothetical protein